MARRKKATAVDENIDPRLRDSSEAHGTTPARQRASWNSACDAILLESLGREQADSRMTSNGSFHDDAWKAAEKALAGTEVHSGGVKKSADSCKYRNTLVSTVSFFDSFTSIDIPTSIAQEIIRASQDLARQLWFWMG